MTYARVKDKVNGNERRVTVKAYNLIQNRYQLLGYEDEEGNTVEGPQAAVKAQKKSVAVVERVVSNPPVKMTDEERAAKRAELQALNQSVIDKTLAEQKAKKDAEEAEKPVEKVRQKPGPKPKQHAQV